MTSDKQSVQDKIQELDMLVGWFQGDEFRLEDAKAKLQKAASLAGEIEKELTVLTNDINELKQSFQVDTEA